MIGVIGLGQVAIGGFKRLEITLGVNLQKAVEINKRMPVRHDESPSF
jgi:hypothetical protein